MQALPGTPAWAQAAVDAPGSAGLSAVTAQSCTGGLVAAILAPAEKASDGLHKGFAVCTKANNAQVLDVDRALFDSGGAQALELLHRCARGAGARDVHGAWVRRGRGLTAQHTVK